jgi:hypothetical protein
MDTTAKAATRKTSTGTKVYIHTGCTCSKINGKLIKDIDTVAAALAHAEAEGLEHTFCKTSQAPTDTPDQTPEAEAPAVVDFELAVDNRDQFGKQRRDAVLALAEKAEIEATWSGVKNKHRTGNNSFVITFTAAPTTFQTKVTDWLNSLEQELEDVIEEAKAEAKAEGWDSNTRQKFWKNTARRYITIAGHKALDRLV